MSVKELSGKSTFNKCLKKDSKLCDIMSPKILVDDEMAQSRTGKDGITIEIMLHCLLR